MAAKSKRKTASRSRKKQPRVFKRSRLYVREHPLAARILKVGAILLLAIIVLTPMYTFARFSSQISNIDELINHKDTGVVLLDKDGEAFYRAYDGRINERVELDSISDTMEEALLAAEDENFYEHPGYSLRGTLAALYGNVASGDLKKYGGSTITQQVVKNSLLTSRKTFMRKYQELVLAVAIDRKFSKEDILEIHLNQVYFGEGAFGIETAAQTYFGIPASELDLAQSSMLVGLLPAPSAYSPVSGDIELAKERQRFVLDRMATVGFITSEEADDAFAAELAYSEQSIQNSNEAHHFALEVLGQLIDKYGEEEIARSGFEVRTTLDIGAQRQAQAAVQEHLKSIAAYGKVSNGAVVAIDPSNGQVRVMVGSVDWRNNKFGKVNMSTTSRQPGSSFKPIYFAEALAERVITPATILSDRERDFGGGYKPTNFDERQRGDISARYSLANSLNIPAVEVMEKLGVNKALAAAGRLGIDSLDSEQNYGLSLALGTGNVELIEMVNAYAAFANQGMQYEQSIILEIRDKFDDKIFEADSKSERVISEEGAFLISDILSDERARSYILGNPLSLGRPAALKTGTTDKRVDAWTIGYTPQIAVGVWIGNNDNTPMNVGSSAGAGPIWRKVMQSILDDIGQVDFKAPDGVRRVNICFGTELRASNEGGNVVAEYFLLGTEPSGNCDGRSADEIEKERKKKEDEEKEEQKENEDEENNVDEEETPPPDEEENPENPGGGDTGGSGSGGGTGGSGSGSGGN